MCREKILHIAKFKHSQMPNGMKRAGMRASHVTDRLRHGRTTVVKLCDMGNRQSPQLSSLLKQYKGTI
jgi:hypothetical protein